MQGGTLLENPEQIYPNHPPQPPQEDFVTVYSTSTHFLLYCCDKYYGKFVLQASDFKTSLFT